MINLYDFLRSIQYRAGGPSGDFTITEEEWIWLEQYLHGPGHEIHFKAREVGLNSNNQPEYQQDYAIKGNPVDIFSLITEVMIQNANFAKLILMAASFYDDHIDHCSECLESVRQAHLKYNSGWNFNPHKPF